LHDDHRDVVDAVPLAVFDMAVVLEVEEDARLLGGFDDVDGPAHARIFPPPSHWAAPAAGLQVQAAALSAAGNALGAVPGLPLCAVAGSLAVGLVFVIGVVLLGSMRLTQHVADRFPGVPEVLAGLERRDLSRVGHPADGLRRQAELGGQLLGGEYIGVSPASRSWWRPLLWCGDL
jgi:hypothetical protein